MLASLDKIVAGIRDNPKNVRYKDLNNVCEHYFGPPRTTGGPPCLLGDALARQPSRDHSERQRKGEAARVRDPLQPALGAPAATCL